MVWNRVHSRCGDAYARAAREIAVQRLAGQRVALLRKMPDGKRRRVVPDRAGIRLVEAGQQSKHGRLARTVRADEADARMRRHDNVDVRDDDLCSVRFGDACGGESAERTQRVPPDENEPRRRRESGF